MGHPRAEQLLKLLRSQMKKHPGGRFENLRHGSKNMCLMEREERLEVFAVSCSNSNPQGSIVLENHVLPKPDRAD